MVKSIVPHWSRRRFLRRIQAVAGSSIFVSRLPLLEGKIIGVCSLLIAMRVLGSYLVRGDRSSKRPKKNPPCGVAAVKLVEG